MRESDRKLSRLEKAGCVPVRQAAAGEWEVLVVESRWTSNVWVFPKGSVEEGETAAAAAVRETIEEAGVVGDASVRLGCWIIPVRRSSNGGVCKECKDGVGPGGCQATAKPAQRLCMWVLAVSAQLGPCDPRWTEAYQRRRRWVSLPNARSLLASSGRPELLEMLDATLAVLSAGRVSCAPLDSTPSSPHPASSRLSV